MRCWPPCLAGSPSLARVFRDPTLRRLLAAYLVFAFGEWATWVAVIVYAYGRGGPAEAGIVAFVELCPSIVLAPAVAGLGDRIPRAWVLMGSYAAEAILMAATGLALATSADSLLVYLLATLSATAVSMPRPVHASLLPEVVTSPDDLMAANVVSGMVESSGSLLGPLGAGLLIAVGGPAAVFAASAAGTLAGTIAVAGLARRAHPIDRSALVIATPEPSQQDPTARPGASPATRPPSVWAELLAGATTIRHDRRLGSVVAIAVWASFLVGALDIFFAILAIDLLHLGPSGVGFLGTAAGVGATLGAAGALLLVGRERLGVALGGSVAVFGLSIAGLWLAPGVVAAVGLLALAGIGSGLTAVAAQTLIQRLAGDDVMSRVFGVLQGLMMGATAVGCLAVPVLVELAGDRAAFAIAGVSAAPCIHRAGPGHPLCRSARSDAGRGAANVPQRPDARAPVGARPGASGRGRRPPRATRGHDDHPRGRLAAIVSTSWSRAG